jgi:sigma-54 specific flagellar transcriptional regulator A
MSNPDIAVGQKQILVVDNNAARVEQMITVLSFVGEHFTHCTHDQVQNAFTDKDHVLTVILCGEVTEATVALVKNNPKTPFLLHDVVDAIALNTYVNVIGCLSTPLNYAQLTELVHHCHQYHNKLPRSGRKLTSSPLFRSLVGTSKPMNEVRFLIEQVAKTPASVLVLGESGTGKEVVARNIHNLSDRAQGAFVPVNCGAIPAELLESELFGHEKGAFTGAISTRKGRFELAEGGTLFLDEIGDMPQPMQVKLLRVLQERTFERVGGSKSIKADVRIIAATHRDLESMVEASSFRQDLYFRLNVFPIMVPALRERLDDLPMLIKHFCDRQQRRDTTPPVFTEEVITALSAYSWPGNIRELENLVERLSITHSGKTLSPSDLPARYYPIDILESEIETEAMRDAARDEARRKSTVVKELSIVSDDDSAAQRAAEQAMLFAPQPAASESISITDAELPEDGIDLKQALQAIEIHYISEALARSEGVVSRAARLLCLQRTTLVEKMKKLDLQAAN